MPVNIDELYEKYDILSGAKEKISEQSKEYLACIEATKGDSKEKKLAAQIISKFYKSFPSLQDEAINAIMDLCEDADISVQIAAIKVLPLLCKDVKTKISKVIDVLVQLFQLDHLAYTAVVKALEQVFKDDPITTVRIAFRNINTGDELVREKIAHVMFKKLLKFEDKITNELTDVVIEEAKKTIQNSTSNEFVDTISYLSSSKLAKTNVGKQELVDLIAEKAEIDRDFDLDEEGAIERVLMCVEYALPLFNSNVESTKFVIYYTDQILPQFNSIFELKNGELLQLEVLRQLAELSSYCGSLENASVHVVQIFDKMKNFMPPPPEDANVTELPNLEFSFVECLLYAFHRLARQCPDFLTSDPQVLKDFRTRLTYFSRGVQGCKRSLDTTISSKKTLEEGVSAKIKFAPTLLNNINTLIKDLFYQPPVYKCNVVLSFKQVENSTTEKSPASAEKSNASLKRHVPITFDSKNGSSNKQVRTGDNAKLYSPPTGKFSNNFQHYERFSGRGRGGRGRGRGSGRGWRN